MNYIVKKNVGSRIITFVFGGMTVGRPICMNNFLYIYFNFLHTHPPPQISVTSSPSTSHNFISTPFPQNPFPHSPLHPSTSHFSITISSPNNSHIHLHSSLLHIPFPLSHLFSPSPQLSPSIFLTTPNHDFLYNQHLPHSPTQTHTHSLAREELRGLEGSVAKGGEIFALLFLFVESGEEESRMTLLQVVPWSNKHI